MRRAIFSLFVLSACGDAAPDPLAADSGTRPGDDSAAGGDAGVDSCLVALEPRTDIAAPRHARPLYLQASDEPPAEVDRRSRVYTRMIAALQGWFAGAMGAAYQEATFAADPVIVLRSRFTVAEWNDFAANGFVDPDNGTRSQSCHGWYAAAYDLSHGLLAEAGLPALFSEGVNYLGIAPAGGCGAGGLSVVEQPLLDRIADHCPNGVYDHCTSACDAELDPWCAPGGLREPEYACAAVGALAHEIGHGFGLPHCVDRPICNGESLMDQWWEYGREVTLSDQDRQDLMESGYFAAPP